MKFLLTMAPDFLTILIAALIIACPLLAVSFYVKNKELKKQLKKITRERDELIG